MPYINPERRENMYVPETAGELNYAVTKLCIDYIDNHGVAYSTFNEIVGALECAKLELYRRMISPYEDEKILENGDVYDDA